MADASLSTLFPALPVTVGGERLMLRALVLGELPVARRVLEGWRLLVATGGTFLDASAWEDLLELLAASVSRDQAWLAALPEADFEQLICLALAINEEIWKGEESSPGEVELPWSELAQQLVEHGHRFEEIKGYTLAQARAFLQEGYRSDREAFARQIQAAAFAMADAKAVKQTVKELRRG